MTETEHLVQIADDGERDDVWYVFCDTCDEYDTEEFDSVVDAEALASEWAELNGGTVQWNCYKPGWVK